MGTDDSEAAKNQAGRSQDFVRNFCIIAHIDHGKSTLADRMLELTDTVSKREMKEQLLDQMDLEREKGITIKLQPVRMEYRLEQRHESRETSQEQPSNSDLKDSGLDGVQGRNEERSEVYKDVHRTSPGVSDAAIRQEHQRVSGWATEQADAASVFQLNLIDTPGHVDFSYEVSRSLQACEGALLVVDATQGIQAQTLSNVYLAIEQELTIIPVINKIDLPAAQTERVSKDLINLLGCEKQDIIKISAKTGENIGEVLDAIIRRIPPPSGSEKGPTRALIFDSVYDEYRGVILYVRVVDGKLKKNQKISMIGAKSNGIALEVGALKPKMTELDELATGQIGYVVTNLKSVEQARVGDTVTLAGLDGDEVVKPLPGYKEVKPFVYAGVYPASSDDYQNLKEGIEKLKLNDASLQYEPESSSVLGHGFRVGFLGLLHLEIVKERLERAEGIEIVITNPSTDYVIVLSDGTEKTIKSASELPEAAQISAIKEPWIKGEIVVPKDYLGGVIQLVVERRGIQKDINYLDDELALMNFEAPLANMLTDFYDHMKNVTSGYGSFNYELADYRPEDLVKLDFLIGGELVDSLSLVVHRNESVSKGREIVKKLKEVIPRQLFEVSLQAAIGGKIIAREDVKALGKNVTGHLYGGDVSRKKKLWAKQKAGKARMKKFGKVEIPNEAFTVLIKKDD